MNKNRNVLLFLLAALAASGCMQAEPVSVPRKPAGPQGRRLPSQYQKATPESSKSFSKQANELWETLKDDWKCLRDRKRKCTWKQKGRITAELFALAALVGSGVYVGFVRPRRAKRAAEKAKQKRMNQWSNPSHVKKQFPSAANVAAYRVVQDDGSQIMHSGDVGPPMLRGKKEIAKTSFSGWVIASPNARELIQPMEPTM